MPAEGVNTAQIASMNNFQSSMHGGGGASGLQELALSSQQIADVYKLLSTADHVAQGVQDPKGFARLFMIPTAQLASFSQQGVSMWGGASQGIQGIGGSLNVNKNAKGR